MLFEPNNHVIKLCAEGMELEGEGNFNEAGNKFTKAWNDALNDFEKFTAAHYVARHQESVEGKLFWDRIALSFALKIDDENMKANLPSLYLNIGKCLEDLGDFPNAEDNYRKALSHVSSLPDNGYGQMIKSGIEKRLKRLFN
jgi:tetratricopeptide (TPR) repeat protein